MNDEKVEVIESIPTKIKYKDIIWIPESKRTDCVKKKKQIGNVKKSYIVKWIEEKQVGDVFIKDDFYKLYPRHKKDVACKRRVDEAIQNMILEGCITVHENIPGKYRVIDNG